MANVARIIGKIVSALPKTANKTFKGPFSGTLNELKQVRNFARKTPEVTAMSKSKAIEDKKSLEQVQKLMDKCKSEYGRTITTLKTYCPRYLNSKI